MCCIQVRLGMAWQARQSMARFVLFRIGEERLVKSGRGKVLCGMAGMVRRVVLRQA